MSEATTVAANLTYVTSCSPGMHSSNTGARSQSRANASTSAAMS
jgi:hypothetical protein